MAAIATRSPSRRPLANFKNPKRLEIGAYFGRNQRVQRVGEFILSETHYAPFFVAPPHFHELAYFCYLVEGCYWESGDYRRVTYQQQSLVFHPPQQVHHGALCSDGRGRCFHFEVSDAWMDRLHAYGSLPSHFVDYHAGPMVGLSRRLYREFVAGRAGAPLIMEGIVLEMMGSLVRNSQPQERQLPIWLKVVVDRIHTDFVQSLTIEQLADDVGVHPVRLSRTFRRTYGCALGEYVRQLRVQDACERLAHSRQSLAEIALATGFSDQSHLTRVFKQIVGITPGAYRAEKQW